MTIKTYAEVKSTIGDLSKRNATLREDIHATLVDIADHVFEHGDTTLADNIVSNMKGTNKNAMAGWLTEFAGVNFSSTGPAKLNKKLIKETEFNYEYLLNEAPKWWTMGDAPTPQTGPVDVVKLIEALSKKISKGRADDRKIVCDVDGLAAALATFRSVLANEEASVPDPQTIQTQLITNEVQTVEAESAEKVEDEITARKEAKRIARNAKAKAARDAKKAA